MIVIDEYRVLSDCVEQGITIGQQRAYKHTQNPTKENVEIEIYNSIMAEINEYFKFNNNFNDENI